MSQFIRSALINGKIDMEYAGQDMRSFCYIEDAIETMWNILLHGKQPVYNVAGISTYSMAEVATQIAELMSVKINLPVRSYGLPGSYSVCMSMERAKKEFDKRTYIGLRYGLQRTIDWTRGFYEPI